MRKRFFLVVTVLLFGVSPTDAQVWSTLKEKAKDAWESDTRREMWEKTKDLWSEALDPFCYTVPVTERQFVNIIPDSKLNELGAERYNSFIRSAKISDQTRKTAQVKRVAQRLAKAADQLCATEAVECEFDWEFNLVRDNAVNAWCMPGGKIVVYEGILSVTNDDASLAIVLGHEIAHAICKHQAEQLTKGLISAAGMASIYMIVNSSDMSASKKLLTKLLASTGVGLANLKFSREDETEADRLGLIIAAMAGYNPDTAVGLWERMGKATNSTGKRDWYSTHPSANNRISNIKAFLPEAREYYRR